MVNKYNYKPSVGKSFDGVVSKTEKYGYIPASKQIENIKIAGKTLDAYRSGLYLYNANSMENLSVADVASLKVPFYNDELSLREKVAYMAGIKRAFFERISKDKEDTEKVTKLRSDYDMLAKAFAKVVSPESSETPAESSET